ncbi:flagellar basal body P-ring formation protein FlgA [Marinobacter sp. M3C]|uniref:flagellar basal body P-ring formation chaperone FlgA n=1 Tax=Marinobacter sp. M3C TaxID=2917715 RepID=UPI00200BFFC7|nr:flagellar basal body P-ring formation chaperone FlgA [Marinobacter sp. M3C]UQG60931.1 flagellar basal body P-ring formation protein FlgA [Marinobacter sp. M3C]
MRKHTLVTALLGLCLSPFALANSTAHDIHTAANLFLQQFATEQAAAGYEVSYESAKPDPRLSLAACSGPLSVHFSGDPWKSGQPSMLIECSGERPWRMYLGATVDIRGLALVASRPLARGERLRADMLSQQTVVVNASRRGTIAEAQLIIGMEVRRSINSGSLITPDLLSAPDAVERGDHVMITASSGSFTVRSRGKALANAAIGEQVLVENLQSSRTIKGRVTAPGQVLIPM